VAAKGLDGVLMFQRFADRVSELAGSPVAFALAMGMIVVWVISGFIVGFSDTHQLIINTSTTIVTFLMVFLIQSSQNSDTAALHLKMDEILRAIPEADDTYRGIEKEAT
jgi:low affinity Fe/Cu permease